MRNRRIGRKTLMIALLGAAVAVNFLASACGIKKPQAPSWMTAWDLPLINHQYQIAEILDCFDNPNLSYDSLGNPGINITCDIDTVIVDSDLSFAGNTMNIRDTVGVIDIESPNSAEAITYLDQIVPVNMGYVPPAPVDFSQAMEPMSGYTWADVLHGTINLTLFNNLEISFDTLTVTVIDSADMHVIGVVPFDQGLAYLETETHLIDISGQTVSNRILVNYHGHTPGGVLINAGQQSLEATAAFPEDMTVTAALAETPEIIIEKNQRYYINDSTKVDYSTIDTGSLHFVISNDTDLPIFSLLHSSNFRQNGIDFSATRQLNARSQCQFDIDISGYEFLPSDGIPLQFVTVEMTNIVSPSAPEQYLVRAADSVTVHIDISEIIFQSVTGQVEPITVDIEPVTQEISLPDGVNQAQMTQGYISLTVANNSQIPAFLNMTIEGGGQSLELNGPVAPKLSADAPPAVTVLTLGPEETAEFLNPPPPAMTFSGTGIMNPDYGIVTINQNDMFTGRVAFSSSFSLTIRDTVEVEPEISRVSLESRPEDFQDDLKFGKFNATMENHLPLGSLVTIYIGHRSDSTLYTDPSTLVLGPYHLPPASVDGNGIVNESISSIISDSLDSAELEIFNNDSLFFGQRIELLPTGDEGATLTGNDFVRIRAQARLHLLVTE